MKKRKTYGKWRGDDEREECDNGGELEMHLYCRWRGSKKFFCLVGWIALLKSCRVREEI
tara:strand:- start:2318 stop:2494 length:177 start_codon:yes stop_codon:yes gene_type:complete